MKIFLPFFLLCITITLTSKMSGQVTVSGHIYDGVNGESIISANIYDESSLRGTLSNEFGYFIIKTPQDSIMLNVSYVGYEPYKLNVTKDTVVSVYLKLQELKAINITARPNKGNSSLSIVNIPVKQLKQIPMLGGETDLLKSLTFIPGISSGVEGTSNLYVRGGSPDQNLILLDDSTIYNSSHLFGFISSFNSDAIKDVKAYKGAFPPEYGGRLSSIIDINMKEGNNQKLVGEGSIGLVSSKVLLEGPLVKDKVSFLLAGRASYLGLFLLPRYLAFKRGNAEDYSTYWLYDTNAKLNYKLSEKHHLYLSGYLSNDYLKTLAEKQGTNSRSLLNWGNRTLSLRHTGILKENIFLKNYVNYSQYIYNYKVDNSNLDNSQEIEVNSSSLSSLKDYSFKTVLEYSPNSKNYIKLGGQLILHQYDNLLENKVGTTPFKFESTNRPLEYALFLGDEIKLSKLVGLNLGLRLSGLSTKHKNYWGVEPRTSINLFFSNSWKANFAYSYTTQYLHLLSSNGVGLPNDIWVPSTSQTPPSNAHQVSLGLTKEISGIGLEASVEGYWKSYSNLISYKQGTNFLNGLNAEWENFIEREGTGSSYGMEFLLMKKQGKLSGWLGYTLAWSERKFKNINDGASYPFKYDRRHDFSIIASYDISPKWTLFGNWVFSTGHPVTLPKGFVEDENGIEIPIFDGRNNARMPNYHRLDLGAKLKWVTKRDRKASISTGAYNTYNRSNPFYLDFKTNFILDDPTAPIPEVIATDRTLVRKGVFPILPYINFNINFGQ